MNVYKHALADRRTGFLDVICNHGPMEDVVVVTENGVENLSASLPMEMDDIEALMKEEGIIQKMPGALW